jgi:inner membrane protein
MQGGTHVLIGVGSGVLLADHLHITDMQTTLLICACAFVGALLPDLDHGNATLRQKLGIIGDVALFWLKHRGPTHSLLMLILVAVLGLHFHPIYGLAVAVGYGSHIMGDMMTRAGIVLFWPMWDGKVFLLPPGFRLTTGGIVERLIAVTLFAALAFYVVVTGSHYFH